MKKKVISLLLVTAMAATMVAGCGEKKSGGSDGGSDKKYSGVKLNYWSMWANTEPQGKVLQEAVDKFEEETGAEVTIEWKNRDIKNILSSALESKEKIDIFEDDYKRIAQNYGKFVADLTEMAEEAGYADKSYPVFVEQGKEWGDGKLTSIAEQPQVGGIFYNKDLFEKAKVEVPTTWDEFMDVCKTLKENDIQPLALDSTYASFAFGYHLSRYIGQEVTGELAKNGGWSAEAGVVEAADDMIEFVKAGYLADGAPDAFPASQNKIGLSTVDEDVPDVAMVVCANYVTTEVNNNTQVELNWGLFNYPGNNAELASSAYAGANSIAITEYSENKQAAFDLAMMITSGEFDQKMADSAGQIPADPANTAPASQNGTVEVLKETTSPLSWNMGLSDDADKYPAIDEIVVQLFEGKFASGADFAAALDGLY